MYVRAVADHNKQGAPYCPQQLLRYANAWYLLPGTLKRADFFEPHPLSGGKHTG